MAKITDNLKILSQTKIDIKNAIEEKGQSLAGVPFTKYAEKILKIVSGGSENLTDVLDSQEVTIQDLEKLFAGMPVDGGSMDDGLFNRLYVRQLDLFNNILVGDYFEDYTEDEIREMENIFIDITQGRVLNG